jgi:hypothetical protein
MRSAPPPSRHASSIVRVHPLALCACLAAAFGPPSAHAAADDPRPYRVGISQTEVADTNVFRQPSTSPRNRDLISTTSLFGSIDQPIGRARLIGNLQGDATYFKNNRDLNYNGGNGALRLNWESIERLSGDFSVYGKRTLYRSDPTNATVVTQRDVLTNSGVNARARVGLVTLLSIDGGLSYDQSRHSSTGLSRLNMNQTSGTLGLRLRPSDLWSVRLGLRETRAEYPRFAVDGNNVDIADEIRRHDVDLSGDWHPTGNSKLDARVSFTRENHSYAGARSSHLWTGLLGYDWILTGKTRLRTQLSRDTNVGNSDSELRLVNSSATLGESRNDNVVRNALELQGTWDATSKIKIDARYGYSRRKLSNTVTLQGLPTPAFGSGRDALNTVSLGVSYKPLRHLEVGCSIAHEQRDTRGQTGNTNTYAYKVDTGTCVLKASL